MYNTKGPENEKLNDVCFFNDIIDEVHVKWGPVTTTWRIFRLPAQETAYRFGRRGAGSLQIY
jgi:hypothetical protein